jgi:hypothetical protein
MSAIGERIAVHVLHVRVPHRFGACASAPRLYNPGCDVLGVLITRVSGKTFDLVSDALRISSSESARYLFRSPL